MVKVAHVLSRKRPDPMLKSEREWKLLEWSAHWFVCTTFLCIIVYIYIWLCFLFSNKIFIILTNTFPNLVQQIFQQFNDKSFHSLRSVFLFCFVFWGFVECVFYDFYFMVMNVFALYCVFLMQVTFPTFLKEWSGRWSRKLGRTEESLARLFVVFKISPCLVAGYRLHAIHNVIKQITEKKKQVEKLIHYACTCSL